MRTTFKCKYCLKDNEISEAIASQIEEDIRNDEREKAKATSAILVKQVEAKASEKAKSEYELTINTLTESAKEEKERNNKLLVELTELNKKFRDLERKDEERELANQKKMTEIAAYEREQAKKQADEEKTWSFKIKTRNYLTH